MIDMWPKASEAQKYFSFFFNAFQLASTFEGILTSAFRNMEGNRGDHAWRWLFMPAFSRSLPMIW